MNEKTFLEVVRTQSGHGYCGSLVHFDHRHIDRELLSGNSTPVVYQERDMAIVEQRLAAIDNAPPNPVL